MKNILKNEHAAMFLAGVLTFFVVTAVALLPEIIDYLMRYF